MEQVFGVDFPVEIFPGTYLYKLQKHEDSRGFVIEGFRSDWPKINDFVQEMAYFSVTKPGVSRGPHEHGHQSDFFVFCGPGAFEIRLWDIRGLDRGNTAALKKAPSFKEIVGQDPFMSAILVPPGVVHGYKCISSTFGVVINLPDKLYKGYKKLEDVDEIRWEAMQSNPFKMD
jgi:dTDP-4-dehydrorhamnose 3,5-epimerase